MAELEEMRFASREALRVWLAENQDSSPGIWLVIAKKGAQSPGVSYAEAVDVGLEFGWIDGQAKSRDEQHYLQRFTPRRPQSSWSKRNRTAAESMIAEKRMSPRGLAEVERARADGRWDRAYDGPRDAQPHPDLVEALALNPAAAAFYATLSSQNRFAIYLRIQQAKRPETRARRIAVFVEMLERGETVY
jgi:uncharacterized protein YdeI (YjbR/CyaY-like superfamily)